ncbi:MAG: DUF2764 family protein [Spirochaetaceae bacterium]
MGQYYYTVATLPMLTFEAEHFPTVEDFFDLCSRRLSRRDLGLLEQAVLVPDPLVTPRNRLVAEWYEREAALRNELARQRAAQLNRDEHAYIRAAPDGGEYTGLAGISEVAREALGQDTPLKAEMVLLRHRWSVLEEMEVAHHFDIERLIVYYLKLQILWRKRHFDREEGTNVFERTYHTVRRAVSST